MGTLPESQDDLSGRMLLTQEARYEIGAFCCLGSKRMDSTLLGIVRASRGSESQSREPRVTRVCRATRAGVIILGGELTFFRFIHLKGEHPAKDA